jgi:hypothetical protein
MHAKIFRGVHHSMVAARIAAIGASANAQKGSVTVTAVILAPISLAKAITCSTALKARYDSSVGNNSIF